MRLATFLLSGLMSVGAMANGYWDYREVCDYEQVQINTPKTNCTYRGSLHAIVGGVWMSYFVVQPQSFQGHSTCAGGITTSTWANVTDPVTGEWVGAWFDGYIPLVSQSHTYDVSYETRQVEGSCRFEQVWVPLCPTCEIP